MLNLSDIYFCKWILREDGSKLFGLLVTCYILDFVVPIVYNAQSAMV